MLQENLEQCLAELPSFCKKKRFCPSSLEREDLLLISVLLFTERPLVVSSELPDASSDASYFTVEKMQLQAQKALISSSKSTAWSAQARPFVRASGDHGHTLQIHNSARAFAIDRDFKQEYSQPVRAPKFRCLQISLEINSYSEASGNFSLKSKI